MNACALCHQEVAATDARTIPAGGRDLLVHFACFGDFAALVKEVNRGAGTQLAGSGLDRLVRMMDGQPVLVHRSFPNEQMPFLAYLATQKDPSVVAEMYKWAVKNEVRVANPANQVQRLRNKNLISTFDKDGQRYAVITEDGRKAVADFLAALESSGD